MLCTQNLFAESSGRHCRHLLSDETLITWSLPCTILLNGHHGFCKRDIDFNHLLCICAASYWSSVLDCACSKLISFPCPRLEILRQCTIGFRHVKACPVNHALHASCGHFSRLRFTAVLQSICMHADVLSNDVLPYNGVHKSVRSLPDPKYIRRRMGTFSVTPHTTLV